MTDYYLGVPAHSLQWEYPPSVSMFPPVLSGGVTRTHERVGMRRRARFTWDRLLDQDAARLKAFIANQRNGANRFWAYDPGYQMRGSFPASELLTNNEFDGTTGWESASAQYAISASDRALRAERTSFTSAVVAFRRAAAATAVAGTEFALRALLLRGNSAMATGIGIRAGQTLGGAENGQLVGTNFGLLTLPITAINQTLHYSIGDEVVSGGLAGDHFYVPYTSISRCARVDNGPNLVQRSEEINNAYWTPTRATISTNATAAPNGLTTAERIVEDSSTNTHFVAPTSDVTIAATADLLYAFSCALQANTRTWAALAILEATGGTAVRCYFNLSTGALGTASVGANWSEPRGFIRALGNGWYHCTIIGRKANAATALSPRVEMATADSTNSYTGDGASNLGLWRPTLAQSGQPTRLISTVASALPTGTAQTGSGIYVKGLQASTNGLLLAGDEFEVITPTYSETKTVTAPLNSDAAGLGYLQFDPAIRNSPADNAAVIVLKPMRRFLLENPGAAWSQLDRFVQGPFSFTAVEDVAA